MPLKLERREIIGHMKKFVISAEEILDLKDDLESRIVERAKGSGLRPTSVQDARLALELKKKEHKKLWNDIGKKYYPFLMDIQITHLQRELATPVRKPPVAHATPVRREVATIAEPVLSGEVVEPEPEPETKPEERDLEVEMMRLGREAGWDLPPIPGETRKQYFKRLKKYKRGKKSSSCCGSKPRMKKKQTTSSLKPQMDIGFTVSANSPHRNQKFLTINFR